ncbi:MAG: 30S ribosomal protein S2, partial [Patescibacteria group bacterium]
PDKITYPIPANDDAAKAVELILQALVSLPTKEKKAQEAPVAENVEEKPKKTAKPKADKATKKVAKTAVKKTVKKKK